MELTHNPRNFSRIKNDAGKIARVIVIGLILTGIALSINAHTLTGINNFTSPKKVFSQNNNLYLREAVEHFGKYLEKNDEDELAMTIDKLNAFLKIYPDNPYALRLIRTLEIDSQFEIDKQIKRTLEILRERGDYAAAWLRLSILYKQKGDRFAAENALREAKRYDLSW